MNESNSNQLPRLIIFAKAPIQGHVKTRLQSRFSPAQATVVHRLLVEHCLSTVHNVSKNGVAQIELWVGSEHHWWQELEKKFPISIYQQRGDDLGERMENAAIDALSRGSNVAIIGTDCPFISYEYLSEVYKQLKADSDVVLGPAEDGGYVMVGFKKVHPPLFRSIAWGTSLVLEQTRERLRESALSWVEMPVLRDVDRPEDVDHIYQELPQFAEQFAKYVKM